MSNKIVEVDASGQPLDPELALSAGQTENGIALENLDETKDSTATTPDSGSEGQIDINLNDNTSYTIENMQRKKKNALESDEEETEVSEDGLPKDVPVKMEEVNEKGTIKRFATIMNLVNSVLGAGILGVPNSMHNCGVIVASILIIIVALMTEFGAILTIKLQHRTRANGFDELAGITLGKFGMIAVPITVFLFSYSCMVAYLVVACDSLISWFSLGGIKITGNWRSLVVLINSLVLPIPLCIPRSIQFLSYFSFATFVSVFIYFIAMVVKAIQILPNGMGEGIVLAKGGMPLFSAISVYALSFCLPSVMLPILHPYNKSVSKRSGVTTWTMAICSFLVLVPNILGYLCTGDKVTSNILLSFPDDDYLILVVRIGFYLVVSFSFPVIGQSVMSSWSEVIYKKNDHAELDNCRRAIVILLTTVIPLVIAMFLSNITPALSVGGAVGGALDSFVFPPIMWVALSKRPKTAPRNLLMIAYAVVGLVVSVICIYQSIVDAITAFS